MKTTDKRCIGLLMAKWESRRLPNKNLANLGGHPLMKYPLESLRLSGICDEIVVSTDSDEIGDLAMKYGANSIIKREPEWDDYPTFEPCIDASLIRYQEMTGKQVDECAVIAGNAIFIRPSWFRVAVDILRNMLFRDMPVMQVLPEIQFVSMGVFRVTKGHGNYSSFRLQHKGIICDVDESADLQLANQVLQCIRDGRITYSMNETVHEDVFRDRNYAHFSGLTEIEHIKPTAMIDTYHGYNQTESKEHMFPDLGCGA